MDIKSILLAVLILLMADPSGLKAEKKKPAYKGYISWVQADSSSEYQMSVDTFLASFNKHLMARAKDSTMYPLSSFDLIFKEVGVYENAAGKREVMADVKMVSVRGNELDSLWVNTLNERLAWGDTIYIDNAKYKIEDKYYIANPLKIYFYRSKRRTQN